MSEANANGNANIQELIDRYNNELMQYQRQAAQNMSPLQAGQTNAQPNRARDEAYEQGMREREQGLKDLRQGLLDAAEGEREADRGRAEREYWLQQGTQPDTMRDEAYEQGMREREQGLKDLRQGLLDAAEGEREADRGRAEREYWLQQDNQNNARRDGAYAVPANTAPRSGDESNEMRMLHDEVSDGLVELKAGLIELAKGLVELKKGLQELKNGLLESIAGTSEGQVESSSMEIMADMTRVRPEGTRPLTEGVGSAPYTGDPMGECCGYLQVAVFTARQAMPVEGAVVTVSRMTPKGERVYATSSTGQNGKTPDLELPAAQPNDNYLTPPYVNYRVRVNADGYYPQNNLTAKVFRDITATLPVELIPLPASSGRQ